MLGKLASSQAWQDEVWVVWRPYVLCYWITNWWWLGRMGQLFMCWKWVSIVPWCHRYMLVLGLQNQQSWGTRTTSLFTDHSGALALITLNFRKLPKASSSRLHDIGWMAKYVITVCWAVSYSNHPLRHPHLFHIFLEKMQLYKPWIGGRNSY
jgi:hypothetical protein